jgi:YesN/AraC family two-component response regulator
MNGYRPANKTEFKALYSSLAAWYGQKKAQEEIAAYCPQPVSAAETAEKILKKVAPPTLIQMEKIKQHWEEIAGIQIAKVATPFNLKEQIIYAVVSHPAWLREFNKGPVKKILVEKINKLCGKRVCKDIKFIPQGR